MPAKRGEAQIDVGTFRQRKQPPGTVWYANDPDPIRDALNGVVDHEQWERIREAVWGKWLRLVGEPPMDEADLWTRRRKALARGDNAPILRGPRDDERAWPPRSAVHDGLFGKCLARRFHADSQIPWMIEMATEGLRELDRFLKRSPDAAATIAEPLQEYGRRLRQVCDDPETRRVKPTTWAKPVTFRARHGTRPPDDDPPSTA
jgi:hypothetical protein